MDPRQLIAAKSLLRFYLRSYIPVSRLITPLSAQRGEKKRHEGGGGCVVAASGGPGVPVVTGLRRWSWGHGNRAIAMTTGGDNE